MCNDHLFSRCQYSLAIGLAELGERPVPGFLDIVREGACRKLFHPEMILDAGAAVAFFIAGFICAVAVFHVDIGLFTFDRHLRFSSLISDPI